MIGSVFNIFDFVFYFVGAMIGYGTLVILKSKNKKMITALITGADGFIGSHLTELLLEKGYKVRALAYYNSFNNWGWLEDIPSNPNLEIVTGDIRDPNFVRIMKGIEIVFHLAALIAIPYSYVAPDSYVDTNIKGTLNVCQAARELEVKE